MASVMSEQRQIDSSRSGPLLLWKAIRLVGQFGLLYCVYLAGERIVQLLRLPIPAALVGIVLLVVLLFTGAVRVDQMREVSAFIGHHLSFFFMPLVILGVLEYYQQLVSDALPLAAALVVSVGAGLAVSGLVFPGFRFVQKVLKKEGR